MSAVDARKEHYEAVEILGIPGLFTTLRIDRATIPKACMPMICRPVNRIGASLACLPGISRWSISVLF